MTHQFKTIDAEGAEVMFAAFEGDNEAAIVDAGSNGDACYLLLVVNHGAEEPFELLRAEFETLRDAITGYTQFLIDEYAGA